jgi:hypothetical protein
MLHASLTPDLLAAALCQYCRPDLEPSLYAKVPKQAEIEGEFMVQRRIDRHFAASFLQRCEGINYLHRDVVLLQCRRFAPSIFAP